MKKEKKKQAKIPGYKAVGVLGKGVQGVVYKGVHEESGMPVAIKVLSRKWAKIREFKERFLREYTAARALDHPNIVKGLKAGVEEGMLYYVMEFVEGKTLSALTASGPLPEGVVLKLGIQAADALAYAHENNVIHRDVKPGNFIVSPNGRLKVLDLGLAKETTSTKDLTLAGSVFGTPNYISPEAVHDSKAVDARSDIYSLGATLYEAATGRPPFEGQNAILIMEQVCRAMPDPPGKVNPALSESLSRIILQTLAKRPADRYGDASELKADLERVLKGEAPLAKVPPTRPRRSPSGRQRKSSRRISSRPHAGGKGFFARILGRFGLGK